MVNNTSSDNIDTDGVLREIIVFPYIRSISNKITKFINKSKNMIGYRCLNELNKFIKVHKDKNQYDNSNNVIYKVNCNNCDASYVGQTKKQLQTRIKEHRNNIKLDQSKYSAISKHITETNHDFDCEKISIPGYTETANKHSADLNNVLPNRILQRCDVVALLLATRNLVHSKYRFTRHLLAGENLTHCKNNIGRRQ